MDVNEMSELQRKQNEYDTTAANAAAEFVFQCQHHFHRGVLDCEDKFVVYGNDGYRTDARSRREAVLIRLELAEMGFEHQAFGLSKEQYSWAVVAFNYQRQPVSLSEIEERLGRAWEKACAHR